MFIVTPDFIIGHPEPAGTPDPDVLASRRHEPARKQQPAKSICRAGEA